MWDDRVSNQTCLGWGQSTRYQRAIAAAFVPWLASGSEEACNAWTRVRATRSFGQEGLNCLSRGGSEL